jgi:hypothetical protein
MWRSSVVGGHSRGNCAPVVVVVVDPPDVGWVVGTAKGNVATGAGTTVGVGIVDGAAVCTVGKMGTAIATMGDATRGGAMSGPNGTVTPCLPPTIDASLVLPSSAPDLSLSGWVGGAIGQRPTFAGGGPFTYFICPARKPTTQSVPYSQAMWNCQGPRSSFAGAPPQPGPSTSIRNLGRLP